MDEIGDGGNIGTINNGKLKKKEKNETTDVQDKNTEQKIAKSKLRYSTLLYSKFDQCSVTECVRVEQFELVFSQLL